MPVKKGYVFFSEFATPDIWNVLFHELFLCNATEIDLTEF